MGFVLENIRRENKMKPSKKEMTLAQLETLIGKEQVERLFLEHYLTLIGKENQKVQLDEDLSLEDIME